MFLFHFSVVLRIKFASENFSGKENDTDISVTIIMTGGIINQMISIDISFSELTAKSLVVNFITFVL